LYTDRTVAITRTSSAAPASATIWILTAASPGPDADRAAARARNPTGRMCTKRRIDAPVVMRSLMRTQ
jgi:hypothetical protein